MLNREQCVETQASSANVTTLEVEWSQTYGGTARNDASALLQTRDGGYAFEGKSGPSAVV